MPLTDLLKRLRDNPSGHTFTVAPIPNYTDVYLGIDAADRPCLFVRATELAVEPPLRTSQVSLRVGQEYTVVPLGEAARSERLHALRCETSDAPDEDTFLVLVEAFLNRYRPGQVNQAAITKFFLSMARLFSVRPSNDLQGARQGLWGELFMMSRVRGFAFWTPFWHSEATRKFDFSTANMRVEVKTAVGSLRIHHFAHRQIYALGGEEIMIVSLLLRKEEAGLSLRDLILEARGALAGSEQYFKLEQAVRQAGMEAMDEGGPSYDQTEAGRSLAWFNAEHAPHFTMQEPPGVSQTHYRVDLSTAPQTSLDVLSPWLEAWSVPQLEVPTGNWRRKLAKEDEGAKD